VLHWRLLGALIKGDARAAYSRRIVAPSSSLRPLPLDRAAPAPLCSAQAIDPIQSLNRSSVRQSIPSNHSITHQPSSLRAGPPRPPIHHATVAPCSEKKMGLEVRDVRRCPCLCTAPLGRRPARASCKRLGYAKADSCPRPPAVTMATVRPPSLLNHSRQLASCRAPRLCRLSTPPSSRVPAPSAWLAVVGSAGHAAHWLCHHAALADSRFPFRVRVCVSWARSR
jgi:hypothetical protein